MIDARDFLDAVAGYSNSRNSGPQSSVERPIKLGTIDQYYTSGLAKVLFDGETIMSDRGYSWASTYTPLASDRVFLVPVGQSYLIGGTIKSSIPYPRYHEITYASNFQAYNATTFHAPSFTKTDSGIVKLTGLASHTSTTGVLANGTFVGTLPEGFRPDRTLVFPVMTGSTNTVGSVEIRADGTIYTKNNVHGVWFSLSNIMFPTEEINWTSLTSFNTGWIGYSAFRIVRYGKDSNNKIWVQGAVSGSGAAKTVDSAVFNLPSGFRPAPQAYYSVGTSQGSTGFANFYVSTAGDFTWRMGSASETDVTFDGTVFPDSGAQWISPTMTGAWVSYGAGQSPGYYKDDEGIVHLRGLVKSGTINSSMFTLPAGYRPLRNIVRNTTANNVLARVDINSAGNVIPATGSNAWFALDGVTFTAEQ